MITTHSHPHTHNHAGHTSRRDFLRVMMGSALAGASILELAYYRAAWARAAAPSSDSNLFEIQCRQRYLLRSGASAGDVEQQCGYPRPIEGRGGGREELTGKVEQGRKAGLTVAEMQKRITVVIEVAALEWL
jgi:hypothetical protein